MPLGVDHLVQLVNVGGIITVILPLMPLGVDHKLKRALHTSGGSDFTFDAVRR